MALIPNVFRKTPKVPDPYGRTVFHGKLLDNATIAALKECEEELGYELTIVQGIGGAPTSAGTHLEGRAVDLAPYDAANKVRVLKRKGFAVWYRPAIPGLWGAHIHAVLILNFLQNAKGIAAAAFRQIASFLRKRNGLKDDGPDPDPWRADPQPVYVYPPKVVPVSPPVTNVTRARDSLVEAAHALGEAAALLDNADPSRVKARAEIDTIQQLEAAANAALERLPKR